MDRFQYLAVMAACVAVTLPLEFVLGARVWRRPGRLVRSIAAVAVPFLIWDVLAIARGHWTFSERYTTGWIVTAGVPIEEVTFFVVIPVCALLTLGAVRRMRGEESR